MLAKKSVLSCVALITLSGSLLADPPLPLDLIPEDACIGISVRNLAELRKNGDRLFGNAPNTLRPSTLLDAGINMMQLGWTVDEKKPSGFVCLSGTLGGLAADADPRNDFTIGAILAPRSVTEAAKSYRVSVDDLTNGKVHHVRGQELGSRFGTHEVGFRDGQFYITDRAKATAAWMAARTLRHGQSAARQRRLDAADGLIYDIFVRGVGGADGRS